MDMSVKCEQWLAPLYEPTNRNAPDVNVQRSKIEVPAIKSRAIETCLVRWRMEEEHPGIDRVRSG